MIRLKIFAGNQQNAVKEAETMLTAYTHLTERLSNTHAFPQGYT